MEAIESADIFFYEACFIDVIAALLLKKQTGTSLFCCQQVKGLSVLESYLGQ